MLAVVEIQGKQYIITDKTKKIETDSFRDNVVGDKIVLDKVLLFQETEESETEFGTPYIKGKTVEVELTSQEKGKKVYGIKFKKRHRYLKRVNHRQMKATLSIGGNQPKKAAAKKEPETKVESPEAKAAPKKAPAKKTTAAKKPATKSPKKEA